MDKMAAVNLLPYSQLFKRDTFILEPTNRLIEVNGPEEDIFFSSVKHEHDRMNNWLKEKSNFSNVKIDPVPVRSCFGGMAMYRASKYLDKRWFLLWTIHFISSMPVS